MGVLTQDGRVPPLLKYAEIWLVLKKPSINFDFLLNYWPVLNLLMFGERVLEVRCQATVGLSGQSKLSVFLNLVSDLRIRLRY